MTTLLEGPHRRYNPLLEEWVLCSPQRLQRPWEGLTEGSPESRPRYDRGCYLCPGNERANGKRNPAYSTTFAFPNDFPAVVEGLALETAELDEDGLFVARAETGICRVLCFSPRHDLTLAHMDRAGLRQVVEAWVEEVASLGSRDSVRYVQVFENKGSQMGCSNPHPHGQIWAMGQTPWIPSRKLAAQRRYLEARGRDLLGDYLEGERSRETRLVCQNEHWVAVVPFWAVWPFETMLLPVRRVADLPSLASEERDALADVVRRLCVRYDNLFRCSFPYSMGWHGRPTDGGEHPYWRLHAVFMPPLLRSATIRKFLVGYELSAEPQRDITAEEAAARLREVPDRRFEEAEA
jgi:UDPglucose--hexose-1-phosphate uridylyltransferase